MAKDKVKNKKSSMDKAEAGRYVLLLLQAAVKEDGLLNTEESKFLELAKHKLGLWLLQANPWRKLKTSIIYEELLPFSEEKGAEEPLDDTSVPEVFTKTLGKRITREQVLVYKERALARRAEAEECLERWEAAGGEACGDKQLNSAKKKTEKAYDATRKSYKEAEAAYKRRIKKLTSKAYDRFNGARFERAWKKVLQELKGAYLEGELLDKSPEQLGQRFLASFKDELNGQSGQNKDETDKWEGNLERQELIKEAINKLIKGKYKAFLEGQLKDSQLVKREKVRAYLEKRFAELATRSGLAELEGYLAELRQLVEAPKPDKELINQKLNEILQDRYQTFLGKKSTLDLLNWSKVEEFVRKTVEGLPPAPDEATIQLEIAGILKLQDIRVKNNMAEEYGEGIEEESVDETAKKFIRLAQEFYSWILEPEEIKANCVLTDKIQKDYLGKKLTPKTIGYTRDYLTLELATKVCPEPFALQVKRAMLPDSYKRFKLKDYHLINVELFDFLLEQEKVPKAGKARNDLYHKFNLEYQGVKTAPRQLGEKLGSVGNLLEGFRTMRAERSMRRKNKEKKGK